MKPAFARSSLLFYFRAGAFRVGASVALAACAPDQAPSDGVAPAETETGAAVLALTAVPADAACLKVSATSSRTVNAQIPLTAGTSPTFTVDRLPLGLVQFDAKAYAVACAAVGATTAPSWVADAPVYVRIDAGVLASVNLKLVQNGRVAVGVDFEAPPWIARTRTATDLAVIGDTPYGALQIADFPNLIAAINADPTVSTVVHVGDIKNGSSRCDTPYFNFIYDSFTTFKRPMIYTPGDNEWTDCHRTNNGAYDPLERLAVLRTLFYPVPGLSLGVDKRQVLPQSSFPGFETFVENQLWADAGVVFTAVHVVGSNNSLLPWYSDDMTKTDDPVRRIGEANARTAAGLNWLDRSFALAKEEGAAGVVVLMQADMWDATAVTNGFDSTIQKLAQLALAFGKPVLLIEGDSHIFKVDNPFAAGDPAHGVTTPVPNITRIVVQGSNTTPLTEWLKLHVDPASPTPFTWTRMVR